MKFTQFQLLIFLLMPIAVSAQPLADKHAAHSMNCAACHGVEKPEAFAEVPASKCLQCHQQEAIINKFSDLKDRNPHKNHLGEVDCNICHKGHEEPFNYCSQCHQNFSFTFK